MITVFFRKSSSSIIVFKDKVSNFVECHIFLWRWQYLGHARIYKKSKKSKQKPYKDEKQYRKMENGDK